MRNGILTSVVVLLLSGLTANAQQWGYYGYPAAPRYQSWSTPGYYGYGYYGYGYRYNPMPAYPTTVPASVVMAENPQDTSSMATPATTPATTPAPSAGSGSAQASAPVTPVVAMRGRKKTATPAKPEACCTEAAPCCTTPAPVCDPAAPSDPPYDPYPQQHFDRFWITGEYMGVKSRSAPVVPLVTTGVQGNPGSGIIGRANTQILFGDSNVDLGFISGVHLDTGGWLDNEETFGINLGGFYLAPKTVHFFVGSNGAGDPLLVRPVVNATTGNEAGFLDSALGVSSATVNVNMDQQLWGTEVNSVINMEPAANSRLSMLIGGRYVRLSEDLNVRDRITVIAPNTFTINGRVLAPGDGLSDSDDFRTINNFIGGQLGANAAFFVGNVYCDFWAKCGLGVNVQTVAINGSTQAASPSLGSPSAQGGILALPSNIGNHNRTYFSVLPEMGFNTGIALTRWMRLQAGYSFLMWTQVARPGDQIDRSVNFAQVPSQANFGAGTGPARPGFSFSESLFYMHTFTAGLEFHY